MLHRQPVMSICIPGCRRGKSLLQVNETELFPALMHKFEDPDAENGDAMESLFDHPQGESQADASMKQDVQVGRPQWLMSCRNSGDVSAELKASACSHF